MRSSIKLLLFGVVLPGALSPLVYGAVTDSDRNVRVVRVADPQVRVDVESLVDVERIVAEATAAARVAEASVQSCAHARTVDARLEGDLDVIRLRNGSGDVRVRGSDDAPDIHLEAVLCASSAEALDGLEATLARVGDEARIDSEYPERDGCSGATATPASTSR